MPISIIAMQQKQIPLNQFRPGLYQARRTFNQAQMLELAESIQAQGLINPPIVVANNGHYDLVAGERRWRALCAIALQDDSQPLPAAVAKVCQADAPAWLIKQQKLAEVSITANVPPPEADRWVLAAIDNLQREDLTPTEEGQAYALLKKQGYSLQRIARECSVSLPTIKNRLSLVNGDLDPEIGAMIDRGEFPRSQRAIDSLLLLPSDQRLAMAKLYSQNPQSSLDVLERACRKVAEAQQAIPDSKPVPVAKANVVRGDGSPPAETEEKMIEAHPPAGHFCPECRELIRQLAEEMCGRCSVGGLTAACLTCEGFLEFARLLLIRVNE